MKKSRACVAIRHNLADRRRRWLLARTLRGISGGGGGFSAVSADVAGFTTVTRPSERFRAVALSEIAPDRYPVYRPLRYMRYPRVAANPRTPPMPFRMSGGHGCQNCRRGSM